MRKPAFGSKWLDWHYDYDDPPEQASGPADPELVALSQFLFGAPAPAGFRIFTAKERDFPHAPRPLADSQAQAVHHTEAAEEQPKPLMQFCSRCQNFYQSSSLESGPFVCPKCRPNTALEPTATAPSVFGLNYEI
jgi:hypothetical protein